MIITFFGHSQFYNSENEIYLNIDSILKKQLILNPSTIFLLWTQRSI